VVATSTLGLDADCAAEADAARGLDHHPDHWPTNRASSGLPAPILSGQDGLTTQWAARVVGGTNKGPVSMSSHGRRWALCPRPSDLRHRSSQAQSNAPIPGYVPGPSARTLAQNAIHRRDPRGRARASHAPTRLEANESGLGSAHLRQRPRVQRRTTRTVCTPDQTLLARRTGSSGSDFPHYETHYSLRKVMRGPSVAATRHCRRHHRPRTTRNQP
jgi:hypothetical protein